MKSVFHIITPIPANFGDVTMRSVEHMPPCSTNDTKKLNIHSDPDKRVINYTMSEIFLYLLGSNKIRTNVLSS